jgi:hypothetical protein
MIGRAIRIAKLPTRVAAFVAHAVRSASIAALKGVDLRLDELIDVRLIGSLLRIVQDAIVVAR